MCLCRWGFCNMARLSSGAESYTWKRYYLHRSTLELSMKSGRSGGDYSCKSLRGHTGTDHLHGTDAASRSPTFSPWPQPSLKKHTFLKMRGNLFVFKVGSSGSRTWKETMLFRTCGTSHRSSAAPPLMDPSKLGTFTRWGIASESR